MRYGIKYHPKVKEDIAKLDGETKRRIKRAIEEKFLKNPEIFGERLRGTLKDFWKLKVENYRVVFLLDGDKREITVLGIFHRREAYKRFSVENLLRRLMDL